MKSGTFQRHGSFAAVRRFFDGCLEGDAEVSVIESAIIDQLQAEGRLSTFADDAHEFIFGQPTASASELSLLSGKAAEVPRILAGEGVDPSGEAFFAAARASLLKAGKHSSTVSGSGPKAPSRDQAQAKRNYEAAVDLVISIAREGRPPTFEDFEEIAATLLTGMPQLPKGFREVAIYAGHQYFPELKQYPEGEQVEALLGEFREWFDEAIAEVSAGRLAPEVASAQVYRRLVAIHAWPDANGRTTRLCAALVLLAFGQSTSTQ